LLLATLTASSADLGKVDDGAASAAREQELRCSAAECKGEQALENPHKYRVCAGHENKQLRERGFCFGGQTIVNPFAVSHLQSGTLACRFYLLALARRQAEETMASPGLDEETKGNLRLGSAALAFEKDCTFAGVVGQSPIADGFRTLVEGEQHRAAGKAYCKPFETPCVRMGGEMADVPVAGEGGFRKACVANGIVLDESCLTSPAGGAEKVKAAVENLSLLGVSCLQRLGAGAAKAAQSIKDTLKEPRTRLCCGDKGCSSNIFPDSAAPSILSSSNAVTLGQGSPFSTIQLSNEGIKQDQAQLNATLFHEFLHRIGACTNADHNQLGDTYDPVACVPDSQRQTACKDEAGLASSYYTPADISRVLPDIAAVHGAEYTRLLTTPGLHPGKSCFCLPKTHCPSGRLLILRPRSNIDPVYACQEQCFGTTEPFSLPPEEVDRARKLCRDGIGSGQFTASHKVKLESETCQ
jgi:hypothetical protein